MSNFDGIKDKRIVVFTDIALFLLSALAAWLSCVGFYVLSIILFGITAALFATVPSTHTGPEAVLSAIIVFVAPITLTILTSVINPAIYSCAVMLSGFAIAIISNLRLKRIYSISVAAALFAAAAAILFIFDITAFYKANLTESLKLFFDGIKQSISQYTDNLKGLYEMVGTVSDTDSYAQTVNDLFNVAVEQFKLKFIGIFGFVFVIFAFLITEVYKLLCKLLNIADERFNPKFFSVNASGTMCVMFIVFSIISFFSVSRYTSSSGLTSMQLIFTGLSNLAIIFSAFMLIQGIRKLFDFIKIAKAKSKGVYTTTIIILIIGALFDLVAIGKLICYFGALFSPRNPIKKGDDGN